MLLGGGTHAGFFGDVVVQLIAIPLLVMALWTSLDTEKTERQKRQILFAIGCSLLAIVGIQLFPLPAALGFLGAGAALGAPSSVSPNVGWAPLSLSPQATWAAIASLIVPAAVFTATMQLSPRQRIALTWLLLVLGALALMLGFLQILEGPTSSLRFFEDTNQTEAVGFFANRNHFAAQLCVTLVLGGVWLAIMASQMLDEGAFKPRSLIWLTAAAVFLVAVVAGLAMTRSRAGVLLAMAALAGIVLMVLCQRRHRETTNGRRFTASRAMIATVFFAGIFAAQFGLGNIVSRFQLDPHEDLRVPLARTTFDAGLKSLPFGSGLGSFVPVFASAEKDSSLTPSYANRAHNELAEVFLEMGIPGLLLILAFLVWFLHRSYNVWLRNVAGDDNVQLLLQRAAALCIALLLAHSLVDYPLRTTALSSIFAFLCGILATSAPLVKKAPKAAKAAPSWERERVLDRNNHEEKMNVDLHWPEDWRKRG